MASICGLKGKGRPVVDLRGLNDKAMKDAFPLPLQDEILSNIRGKRWVSIFDMQKAYYQRHVAKKDRWKICIITHRGQEVFGTLS
jgi:hypothetical protein